MQTTKMKLEKKDYMFGSAVILIVILLFIINAPTNKDTEIKPTPNLEPIVSENPNPSISPVASNTTNKPKPDLTVQKMDDYEYWFNQMDKENRVFGIYGECTYIVPSNVAHKNNVSVMLDNTRSEKDHVLKIGPTEYALKAGEWRITTLSASQLPAKLTTFCEGIELGQIDLN